MRVAELPASFSKFSESGEKTGLLDSVPGGVNLNLSPRRSNDRKLGCQRIDT